MVEPASLSGAFNIIPLEDTTTDGKIYPTTDPEEILTRTLSCGNNHVKMNEEATSNDLVSLKQSKYTVAAEDMIFLFKNTKDILSICKSIFNGKDIDENSLDKKAIDVSKELDARKYEFSVRVPTLITTMEKIMEKSIISTKDKKTMHVGVYNCFAVLFHDMRKLLRHLEVVFFLLSNGLSNLREMEKKCVAEKALKGKNNDNYRITNTSPFSWNSFAGKLKVYFCRKNVAQADCDRFIDSAKVSIYRFGRGRKSLCQVYPELVFDNEENTVVPTFYNIPKINKPTLSIKSKDNHNLPLITGNKQEDKDCADQDISTIVQASRYITTILQYKIGSIGKTLKTCPIDEKLGSWCGKGIADIVDKLKSCIVSEYNNENTSDVSGLLRIVFKSGEDCIDLMTMLLEEFRQEHERLSAIQSKFLLLY